ncbi:MULTISPECIES: hypothetical protein [unclassified Methylibium]|uniref:hypothetical protein n=1 Tax=Methylibium sp. T29 TaxID=1430884 RepID=UPI0018CC61F0|nr:MULTISPECIES: hypothetical protein [unclassified Methylibium]
MATTLRLALIANVQLATAPLQAPDQPLNRCPAAGDAVRTTLAPLPKLALQALPHSMPTGWERTTPLPTSVTLNVRCTAGAALKVAATLRAWLITTVQLGPAPVQAPPQPVNTWPAAGVALNTTLVLTAYAALHALPQSMPAGCERTVPPPPTDTLSENVDAGGGLKLAVTVRDACIETVQVLAVPAQSPPQPLKTRPAAGVAVSVTDVALSKPALQLAPQLMPAGEDTTLPLPLTATESVLSDDGGKNETPPPHADRPRQAKASRLAKWRSRERMNVMVG